MNVEYRTIRRTAKKPITVYKVIDERNVSLYKSFHYKKNSQYKIDGELITESLLEKGSEDDWRVVEQGIHAYRTLDKAKDEHAFQSSLVFGDFVAYGVKIVECTIPVGAKYYIGSKDEIVSDKIVTGDLSDIHNPHSRNKNEYHYHNGVALRV